jgi:hypothetical protein
MTDFIATWKLSRGTGPAGAGDLHTRVPAAGQAGVWDMRLLAGLVVSAILLGCGQKEPLTGEIDDIKADIRSLERELKKANASIEMLGAVDLFSTAPENYATLTPGSDGFATVASNVGAMFVLMDNVRPYANGSKVRLRFGNLTSVAISSMTAFVGWGEMGKDGYPEEAKSKEVTVQNIRPGTMVAHEVTLDGLPSDTLGYVKVGRISVKSLLFPN